MHPASINHDLDVAQMFMLHAMVCYNFKRFVSTNAPNKNPKNSNMIERLNPHTQYKLL